MFREAYGIAGKNKDKLIIIKIHDSILRQNKPGVSGQINRETTTGKKYPHMVLNERKFKKLLDK